MESHIEASLNKLHRSLSRHASRVAIRNATRKPEILPPTARIALFLERNFTIQQSAQDVKMETLGEMTDTIFGHNAASALPEMPPRATL